MYNKADNNRNEKKHYDINHNKNNRPTDRPTDRVAHMEVTLPIIGKELLECSGAITQCKKIQKE